MAKFENIVLEKISLTLVGRLAVLKLEEGALVLDDGYGSLSTSQSDISVLKFDLASNEVVNIYDCLYFLNPHMKRVVLNIKKLKEREGLDFDRMITGVVNVLLWGELKNDFFEKLEQSNLENNFKASVDSLLDSKNKEGFINLTKGWYDEQE